MNSENAFGGPTAHHDDASGDITVLNTLIGTLLDSVEGYRKAAEDVDNPTYLAMFTDRSNERQEVAARLQAAVAQLGGEPEDDATTLGAIHRVFVDLKSVVTGRDDEAIVKEVERGEDYLKAKFETAIKNTHLSAIASSAVASAWHSVKTGHDQMSALKHSLS